MPRKPTLLAREAKIALLKKLKGLPKDACLPSLGELAQGLKLHPTTIFRILRDLVTEGFVWQSPSGKFFPASARASGVRGLPVCFIGREMWQWSRLYQELLEGVSEVCSANSSPLVLLSAPSLVRQPDPLAQPKFSGTAKQKAELRQLLSAIPRPCGGILFDHLWWDKALSDLHLGATPTVQLVHGSGKIMPVAGPDYEAATNAAGQFVDEHSPSKLHLVIPFEGDPAIDHAVHLLRIKFANIHEHTFTPTAPSAFLVDRKPDQNRVVICPEDNIAQELAKQLPPCINKMPSTLLLATQGTGTLHSPINRLRFDFRRIGKAAASSLLHGTALRKVGPSMLRTNAGL
jgi:hypothetical protein